MEPKFYTTPEYDLAKQQLQAANEYLAELKAAGRRTTNAKKMVEEAEQALKQAPQPKASAAWLANLITARLEASIREGKRIRDNFCEDLHKNALYTLQWDLRTLIYSEVESGLAERILMRTQKNRLLCTLLKEIDAAKWDAQKELTRYSDSVSTSVQSNMVDHYKRAALANLVGDYASLSGLFDDLHVRYYIERELVEYDEEPVEEVIS